MNLDKNRLFWKQAVEFLSKESRKRITCKCLSKQTSQSRQLERTKRKQVISGGEFMALHGKLCNYRLDKQYVIE